MSTIRIRLHDKGPGKTQSDGKRGDTVLWQNQTDSQRTITFDQWPFVEPAQGIVVGAKDRSSDFTVADTATTRAYPYVIDPPLETNGPPDEPSFNVGD